MIERCSGVNISGSKSNGETADGREGSIHSGGIDDEKNVYWLVTTAAGRPDAPGGNHKPDAGPICSSKPDASEGGAGDRRRFNRKKRRQSETEPGKVRGQDKALCRRRGEAEGQRKKAESGRPQRETKGR